MESDQNIQKDMSSGPKVASSVTLVRALTLQLRHAIVALQ